MKKQILYLNLILLGASGGLSAMQKPAGAGAGAGAAALAATNQEVKAAAESKNSEDQAAEIVIEEISMTNREFYKITDKDVFSWVKAGNKPALYQYIAEFAKRSGWQGDSIKAFARLMLAAQAHTKDQNMKTFLKRYMYMAEIAWRKYNPEHYINTYLAEDKECDRNGTISGFTLPMNVQLGLMSEEEYIIKRIQNDDDDN